MKRMAIIFIVVFCLGSFVACNSNSSRQDSIQPPPASSPQSDVPNFSKENLDISKSGNSEIPFEQDFSVKFNDSNYIFSFEYPKELTLSKDTNIITLSSTDPIVVLQIMYVESEDETFDDYIAELNSTFSEITEFSIGDKKAVKGILHVGQGAKRNYVIDNNDGSKLVIQGVVDGSGSLKFIDTLDKIVDGIDISNKDTSKQNDNLSITKCVATPNNSVYGETVYIHAKGDIVTHIQIITVSNVNNPNNDFALKSYQHWLPILDEFYSNQDGMKFSSDISAGTWTIDADINDDTIKALAEYYLDFSYIKKDGGLSKSLLIKHYEAILYTCEERVV